MKGEKYAEYLEMIPEGEGDSKGMTYSDAALLMTIFKSAVNRFFQKRPI